MSHIDNIREIEKNIERFKGSTEEHGKDRYRCLKNRKEGYLKALEEEHNFLGTLTLIAVNPALDKIGEIMADIEDAIALGEKQ